MGVFFTILQKNDGIRVLFFLKKTVKKLTIKVFRISFRFKKGL